MQSDLLADFLQAARRIRRNPRTSAFAVATLSAGIGLAAAVFSVAYSFLLAPLPFAGSDRLVFMALLNRGNAGGFSAVDARDWQDGTGAFESIALSSYAEYSWTGQSLAGFDGSEVLRGQSVSDNYFTTLRGPMAVGRGFVAGEGRDRVVVIGHGLWQRRFAGRKDVVGQTLKLNGEDYRVVGVAGPDFRSYDIAPFGRMMYGYEVQAWTPFPTTAGQRDNRMSYGVGRLKPGISVTAAKSQVQSLQARLAGQYRENEGFNAELMPLGETVARRVRPALMLLIAGVLCLVLITGANVAGLLLARAAGQGREMAIRTALGAGRGRIYRMVFAEGMVLALLAGVGGALISAWALAGLRTLIPATFRIGWAFDFGPRTVLAALIVACIAGLLAALPPALASFRHAARGLAASGALEVTPGRSRFLHGIVTAEIALAVLLTVAAGLCTKAFAALLRTDLGYRTDNLLSMRIRLQEQRYWDAQNRVVYWDNLLPRVRALPGVQTAAAVSTLPMGWAYSGGSFWVEGQPLPAGGQRPKANYRSVTPGYFATLGIPLVEGRSFADTDGPDAEPVAIVNDLLAQKFWPGQSAVGQYLRSRRPIRIVGVVPRVRHAGPTDPYEFEIYFPYRQQLPNMMFLVAKTRVPPETLIAPIRRELRALDANVPAFEIRTMDQSLSNELAMPRLPMALMGVFAAVAALLGALGVFGAVAYWVGRRTRELGVRSALGATRRDLRVMVLRQGARLALIGVAAGLAAALLTARFLESLLYGVGARDGLVYGAAATGALLVTAAACLAPAERAARIDPAAALRHE